MTTPDDIAKYDAKIAHYERRAAALRARAAVLRNEGSDGRKRAALLEASAMSNDLMRIRHINLRDFKLAELEAANAS